MRRYSCDRPARRFFSERYLPLGRASRRSWSRGGCRAAPRSGSCSAAGRARAVRACPRWRPAVGWTRSVPGAELGEPLIEPVDRVLDAPGRCETERTRRGTRGRRGRARPAAGAAAEPSTGVGGRWGWRASAGGCPTGATGRAPSLVAGRKSNIETPASYGSAAACAEASTRPPLDDCVSSAAGALGTVTPVLALGRKRARGAVLAALCGTRGRRWWSGSSRCQATFWCWLRR